MAYIEFPLQFSRQNAAPLDVSSVMSSADKASYLSNPVRYAGQVVYDSDTEKLYVLSSNRSEWLEVGSSSTGVSDLGTRVSAIEGLTATSGTGTEGDFVMLGADGKIATEYLPALAITTTHVVSSYAEVLSLSASVQEGDVAVVNDTVEGGMLSKSFIYTGSSWVELKTPLDASINALSSSLNSAITSLKASGVDALTSSLTSLTSESGVSKLGTIASQNKDAVNITGGTISVSALEVTQGTAKFAGISASGPVTITGNLSGANVYNLSGFNCYFDSGTY